MSDYIWHNVFETDLYIELYAHALLNSIIYLPIHHHDDDDNEDDDNEDDDEDDECFAQSRS